MNIPYLDSNEVASLLGYDQLIKALETAFCSRDIVTPTRHHHEYNQAAPSTSTLLIMPSWEDGSQLGVKLVTVSPNNAELELPAINGVYVLFDSKTGIPKLMLDAKELTVRRTAATSALASKLLSRDDSQSLLIIGTGALAPHLIHAHTSIRPIEKVLIWGRNFDKAARLASEFQDQSFSCQPVRELTENLKQTDIVSCATLSNNPLVKGDSLRSGQHIDLVGSYKPSMREADDKVIERSRVFIDTDAAKHESGDLTIPLSSGVLQEEEIVANLFELTKHPTKGRASKEEITLFKSVGHALEDLVAAQLVFNSYYV